MQPQYAQQPNYAYYTHWKYTTGSLVRDTSLQGTKCSFQMVSVIEAFHCTRNSLLRGSMRSSHGHSRWTNWHNSMTGRYCKHCMCVHSQHTRQHTTHPQFYTCSVVPSPSHDPVINSLQSAKTAGEDLAGRFYHTSYITAQRYGTSKAAMQSKYAKE